MGQGFEQPHLADRMERLCTRADRCVGESSREAVEAIRARFNEPLRIAIAGHVKAGKSTLLNALVGERLAATDAGECTKIVTWYRRGLSYGVAAHLRDGTTTELSFERGPKSLHIDLGDLATDDVDHLEVRWPSSRLANMTLIDTPGLESLEADRSARTKDLFGVDRQGTSEVDGVVYLLRHLHSSDRAFLDAFLDRSISRPSPVNAIAVLSRADEIGAGRLDALESAHSIAGRLAADRRIQALCATVLPVAGLIAESAHSLREDEVAAIRSLCELDHDELDLLLVSVDRFCAPGVSPLTVEARRDLLDRLGLFGIRFCLHELEQDGRMAAAELARRMTTASGIEALASVLDEQVAVIADALRARSALNSLRALAREITASDPAAGRELESEIERVESGAHELAELRLLHLVLSGQVSISDGERDEVQRLLRGGDSADRLGLAPSTDVGQMRAAALDRLEAWRTRASHPLSARVDAEAFEVIAECYERLFVTFSEP